MTTFLLKIKTDAKINMIKAVRTITGMGLKEAKDGVEIGLIVSTHDIEPFLWRLNTQVRHQNDERIHHHNGFLAGSAPPAPPPLITFTAEISLHSPQPAPVPLRFADEHRAID